MRPKKDAFNYHHDPKMIKRKRTPNANTQMVKDVGREIKNITEQYLSGKRTIAINKLTLLLGDSNVNKIRPVLKKSIYSYFKTHRKEFEGSVEIKPCVYEMFSNFDMIDFIAREWQYKPYYIKASDYPKILNATKNPIHIENYDYSQPIYKLANSISYNPRNLKLHRLELDTIKNDTKFYLSNDERMLFAKRTVLRYRPTDLKLVKEHNKNISKEERSYAVYDNYLYNRKLSVLMYVLLDGDPNKAMPYIRYDNDPVPHKNVYIGNDNRREIYGDIALNPHFHFQNEDDSLLCLRQYPEDGEDKFMAGRCNAIDCKHLKKYLLDLDALSDKEVDKLFSQKKNYNMPFLQFKYEKKKVGFSVDNLFANFIKDKTEEEIEKLKDLSLWLSQSKKSPVYNQGKSFDKLIRCIDCLDRVALLMDSSIDFEQRKLYSQLEIVIADATVNAISNNSCNYVTKDYAPKYTIDTGLQEKEETDEENNENN